MAVVGNISIAMTVMTKPLEQGISSARKALGGLQGSLSSAGAIASGLFAAAVGGAATAGMIKAIGVASDLNESMNKVHVIFGDGADTIIEKSNLMAEAVGLSKNELLDSSGKLGGLFNGAGFDKDTSASLTSELIQRAGDTNSISNLPLQDVLRKIQSGLSGEAEPLRELGIFMDDDAIKAQAFASGIAKVGSELTAQQKVAARAQFIYQGLAYTQGDLLKTADDYANAQRAVAGRVENLAGALGTTLLPIGTAVMVELGTGVEALNLAWEANKETILSWATGLLGGTQEGVGGMGLLQKAIGFVADEFQVLPMAFKAAQSYITAGLSKMVGFFVSIARELNFQFGTDVNEGFSGTLISIQEGLDELSNSQFADFKAQLEAPPASEGINSYFDDARERILGLREDLGAAGEGAGAIMGLGGLEGKAKEGKSTHPFAEAMLDGSKEAASVVLKSRYGSKTSNDQAKIAENSTKQVNYMEQMVKLQEEMVGYFGTSAGLELETLATL